jgi:hypothetical protein
MQMHLFNTNQRIKRINYHRPISLSGTFNDLLSCTHLFILVFITFVPPSFHPHDFAFKKQISNGLTQEYRLGSIFVMWLHLDFSTSSDGIIITR